MDNVGVSDPQADSALPGSWRLAQAALGFTIEQVASGLTGLKAMDALLVLAINQANIVLLTRDVEARKAYGALAAPAPDDIRRPVSVHAIATSLDLPFETVRRRIRRLETLGICRHEARGVIVPSAYLKSPAYLQAVVAAHESLKRLYFEISAEGLLDPLPVSAYALSDEPPMRAAARLLSDFLLRAVDILMRHTRHIASGLILAAVVSASPPMALASPTTGARLSRGLSVAEVGRRIGLAPETARRQMARLTADGHCVRGRTGVFASDLYPGNPRWDPTMSELAAALQRLMAGLAERGVIDSWKD